MLIGGLAVAGAAAVWSAALAYYDVTYTRLPDCLTLPAAAVALAACCLWPWGWWGLAWPLAYLVAGPGIGGGDVKLACSLGVVCALAGGLLSVLVAVLVASCLTAAVALVLRTRALAHGPSMLVAAWVVALWEVASTYL